MDLAEFEGFTGRNVYIGVVLMERLMAAVRVLDSMRFPARFTTACQAWLLGRCRLVVYVATGMLFECAQFWGFYRRRSSVLPTKLSLRQADDPTQFVPVKYTSSQPPQIKLKSRLKQNVRL